MLEPSSPGVQSFLSKFSTLSAVRLLSCLELSYLDCTVRLIETVKHLLKMLIATVYTFKLYITLNSELFKKFQTVCLIEQYL